MTRMIQIRTIKRTIQIQPHWAGKGIAIHKPIAINPENGEVSFKSIQGYWRLTHIPTGMTIGCCMGSLDRAKSFAKAWDAEFAALKSGETLAPDRLQAWVQVMEEMKTEPPRTPRASRVRRAAAIAQEVA